MTHSSDRVMKLRLRFLGLCPNPDLHWYAVIGGKVCYMDVWHAAKAAANHLLAVSACTLVPVLPLHLAHFERRLSYMMTHCY